MSVQVYLQLRSELASERLFDSQSGYADFVLGKMDDVWNGLTADERQQVRERLEAWRLSMNETTVDHRVHKP